MIRHMLAVLVFVSFCVLVAFAWPESWAQASRLCPEWDPFGPGCTAEFRRLEGYAFMAGWAVLFAGVYLGIQLFIWARRDPDNHFTRLAWWVDDWFVYEE